MEEDPLVHLHDPPNDDGDPTVTLATPLSIRKQAEALGPELVRYILFTGYGTYLGRAFVVMDGGVTLLGHGDEILVRVPARAPWTIVNARLWSLHDMPLPSLSQANEAVEARGYL